MFGVNFSLDAILLMYINKINNPPINIKNIIIVIQDDFIIFDKKIVVKVVCNNNNTPIISGVLIAIITVEIHIISLIVNVLINNKYFN